MDTEHIVGDRNVFLVHVTADTIDERAGKTVHVQMQSDLLVLC